MRANTNGLPFDTKAPNCCQFICCVYTRQPLYFTVIATLQFRISKGSLARWSKRWARVNEPRVGVILFVRARINIWFEPASANATALEWRIFMRAIFVCKSETHKHTRDFLSEIAFALNPPQLSTTTTTTRQIPTFAHFKFQHDWRELSLSAAAANWIQLCAGHTIASNDQHNYNNHEIFSIINWSAHKSTCCGSLVCLPNVFGSFEQKQLGG